MKLFYLGQMAGALQVGISVAVFLAVQAWMQPSK